MVWRAIPSFLFLAGAGLTWFVCGLLRALVASQAGMSVGPVAGTPHRETVALWLIYGYFAVSAFGILVAKKRRALSLWCFSAHAFALAAFCIVCSELADGGLDQFWAATINLAIASMLFFAPWLIIWALMLMKAERTHSLSK